MNVLITGAGKGLGFELVKYFLKEAGNQVFAVSRNIHPLHELHHGPGGGLLPLSELFPFSFDLVKGDFRELNAFVRMHTDTLDVLVNNAGVLVRKAWDQHDDEDFDLLFHTNLRAAVKAAQHLLEFMPPGGHIVNISSMGGIQGSVKFPGLSLYSASKAALTVWTECLALELKDSGIHANALALGAVQTEMLAEAFPGYQAPLSAEEMARFAGDFAKNGQRFFNGKVLPLALSTP